MNFEDSVKYIFNNCDENSPIMKIVMYCALYHQTRVGYYYLTKDYDKMSKESQEKCQKIKSIIDRNKRDNDYDRQEIIIYANLMKMRKDVIC